MYFIGQRVLVDNRVIATVIQGRDRKDTGVVWVRLPNGVEQWRDPVNVKPLPNGQL